MVKAYFEKDGGHKWAEHKFKKPVDISFIASFIVDVIVIVSIGLYFLYLLERGKLEVKDGIISAVFLWLAINSVVKHLKENKEIKEELSDRIKREYTFDNNGIIMKHTSDEDWGNIRADFGDIEKASERKGYFVFRMVGGKCYSVGYNDITEGTPEELSRIFAENLGKKFVRK